MTREHAKALLPFITAYAEGKTIQANVGSKTHPSWADVSDCNFGCDVESYRIKPEPKLVPMTSDDLPPIFWIRHMKKDAELVTEIRENGEIKAGSSLFAVSALPFSEWSTDRKTWNSFMKEATE